MRYLILSLLLLLSGCYYGPYGYGYGYGYGGYPYRGYPPAYQPNYYTSAPQAQQNYYTSAPQAQQPYYLNQPGYGNPGNPAANDPQNCGTPDQPRPCYR
jgi:hypothetical protein